jgi:hypothetical protein
LAAHPEPRQILSLFGGTKVDQARLSLLGLCQDNTHGNLLILVANLSCVLMIAPPLCQTVGFHSVAFCCRAGGRQIFLGFANSSFFE